MGFAIPAPRPGPDPGAGADERRRRCTKEGPPSGVEGARAEALVVPGDAGSALLRRRGVHTGPVAYDRARERVHLLVPPGSVEELPGLLEWLEWGGLGLELHGCAPYDPREAAVWLRPPGPECGTDRVDLVRLVSAAATECHRARLLRHVRRGCRPGQPLAFS